MKLMEKGISQEVKNITWAAPVDWELWVKSRKTIPTPGLLMGMSQKKDLGW